MTTDNRANEPNKYSGFLARQNHQRDPWRGIGAKCLCGKVFDLDADHALHQVDEILRAALVAAQGAAPQAESVPKSSYISPHLPAQIRGLYRADLREKSIQTMLDLAGDLIQELIDLRAAPVLPSSGVDEDKLAEVIARVTDLWDDPLDEVHDIPQIARAVAEWIREGK